MTASRAIGQFPEFRVLTWILILFTYIPLALMVAFSFNSAESITVWEGWSFEWYYKVLHNERILDAAINSTVIATISSLTATLAALGVALALERGGPFAGKRVVFGYVLLPLVIPEIVLAIAMLSLYSVIPRSAGLLQIILAHSVLCIPCAFLPIHSRLVAMNATFEHAAQDLYANKRQTFIFITLPLLLPGVISGALLAFITSIDDFIVTLMLSQAGTTTLPVYIYSMIRMGLTPEINALSSLMLVLSVAFVSISLLTLRFRVPE